MAPAANGARADAAVLIAATLTRRATEPLPSAHRAPKQWAQFGEVTGVQDIVTGDPGPPRLTHAVLQKTELITRMGIARNAQQYLAITSGFRVQIVEIETQGLRIDLQVTRPVVHRLQHPLKV